MRKQFENDDKPEEPEKFRFAPILLLETETRDNDTALSLGGVLVT